MSDGFPDILKELYGYPLAGVYQCDAEMKATGKERQSEMNLGKRGKNILKSSSSKCRNFWLLIHVVIHDKHSQVAPSPRHQGSQIPRLLTVGWHKGVMP